MDTSDPRQHDWGEVHTSHQCSPEGHPHPRGILSDGKVVWGDTTRWEVVPWRLPLGTIVAKNTHQEGCILSLIYFNYAIK